MERPEKLLAKLFEKYCGHKPDSNIPLPISGSSRQYYRLSSSGETVIGCFNDNKKENIAFLTYTEHFRNKGLPVPEILLSDPEQNIYLLQDLGDQTLFNLLSQKNDPTYFSETTEHLYRKVLRKLLSFQLEGHEGLDYSVAYPSRAFDLQSMTWDLNYFKHYFIKLSGIGFHEQELEDDFQTLANFLLQAGTGHFMYRDFQSRNIMVQNGNLWFIDYQGGRMGSLAYDLASLLFDAKANIPFEARKRLLDYYLSQLEQKQTGLSQEVEKYYYGFVLIRMMQAFGAFGYRGFFERKLHFLQSIPHAINNLKWILENDLLPVEIPALQKIFEKIVVSPNLKEFDYQPSKTLTVLINSFSYKRNIPLDNSGNGGGFVFDCRFLPNPGRLPEYRMSTGTDTHVQRYLNSFPETNRFLQQVDSIVSSAVDNYLERKFHHLMVSFGCTGGQHRSVYFAQQLHDRLKSKFPQVNFKLRHIEMELNPVKKPEL